MACEKRQKNGTANTVCRHAVSRLRRLLHGQHRVWRSVLLGVIVFGSSSVFAADIPAIIAKIKPSIVGVGTYDLTRTPPARLNGTGFAVVDGQHILTNAHVVTQILDPESREYLAVFVGEGDHPQVRRAHKVAVDYAHDLALLKIDGPRLPVLSFGDSARVRAGWRFLFTGFPIGAVLGLYPATSQAMVSARTPIARPMDKASQLTASNVARLRSPYKVFQLDAIAYPGNSGSPLYDPATGKVYAVVNMVFVKGNRENVLKAPSGIAYAMPIQYVNILLKKAGLH